MNYEVFRISVYKVEKDKSGIERPLKTFNASDALESWKKHIADVVSNEVRKLGDNEQIIVDIGIREKPDVVKLPEVEK